MASFRSFFPALVLLVPQLAACTSNEDADQEEAAVSQGALGCPKVLIDHQIKTVDGPGFWEVDERDCLSAVNPTAFETPKDYEAYLAKHPLTSIGIAPDAVTRCTDTFIAEHESARKTLGAHPEEERSTRFGIVSDYYLTMNTIRQATRGTLEAIAGLDAILGEQPLAETVLGPDGDTYEPRYQSPLAIDSETWTKKLRACPAPKEDLREAVIKQTRENLAFLTYNRLVRNLLSTDIESLNRRLILGSNIHLWYKQWDPATTFTSNDPINPLLAIFTKDRNDLLAQYNGHLSTTPWLKGKYMSDLLEAEHIMGIAVDRPDTYREILAMGPVELMAAVSSRIDEIVGQGRLSSKLELQIRANRKLLSEQLGKLLDTADCIHGDETKSCLKKINDVMGTYPAFDGRGVSSDPSKEDLALIQRLKKSAKDSDRALADKLIEKTHQASACFSGLLAAECRSELRRDNQQLNELGTTFVESVAITVATAGLGSWLAASKVALTAAVSAGDAVTAASLTTRVIALNGVFVGLDAFWLGDSVVHAMESCDQYANHDVVDPFVSPLGEKEPYCRSGQEAFGTNDVQSALAPTAVANYRACAFEASVGILINTLGIVPSSLAFKNALKGKV